MEYARLMEGLQKQGLNTDEVTEAGKVEKVELPGPGDASLKEADSEFTHLPHPSPKDGKTADNVKDDHPSSSKDESATKAARKDTDSEDGPHQYGTKADEQNPCRMCENQCAL